tara:strand:+ start:1185 stop:1826 length:642 start_codon:yes stop_codon:yes gene_type:complete
MSFSLSIKLDPKFPTSFHRHIVKEVFNVLKQNENNINEGIKKKLQETIMEMLFNSPAVSSLMGGKLQAELGVVSAESTMIEVIDTWMNNIHVSTKAGGSPLLTINIGILTQGYGDVLSLPSSVYQSAGGEMIEWLRWLLLEGDKTIVDYFFLPGNRSKSRTGLGIMVRKGGRRWSIPPEFRGTETDNFATRALENLDKALDRIVRVEINKVLK